MQDVLSPMVITPIKIRVTNRRQHVYYPTGKNLSKEDWNRLGTSRLRTLLSIRRDVEISFNLIREAVEELTDRGSFSFGLLDARIKGCGTKTILEAHCLARKRNNGPRAAHQYGGYLRALLRAMREFSTRNLQYQDISPSWLMRFEDFMHAQGKSQTTIAIYMRALRGIFNRAKADGIIKEMHYPFGQGRYAIQEGSGRKMALSIKQIGAIAKIRRRQRFDSPLPRLLAFLYLCNGLNVADFVQLRYRDIQTANSPTFVRKRATGRNRYARFGLSSYR